MTSQALTSIIIPIFNQAEFTSACLTALFETSGPHESYEVIVVDNGSTDGSQAMLQTFSSKHSHLRIHSLPENQGFSPACNEGARLARGDRLVFLNNDTIPLEGWLSALQFTARTPEVALVGSKLLYPDTKLVNHAGYAYNPKIGGFYLIYHNFDSTFLGVNSEREFQALLGASILVKRAAFEAVEGFNNYGLEDIDLCLKLRSKGHKVVYCPRSLLYHHGSITLKKSAPGTIPPMTVHGFNDRWPQEKLLWDDVHYYAEDGMDLSYDSEGKIVLKEKVGLSMEKVSEALAEINNKDFGKAKQCLHQALEIYPRNKEALIELLLVHIATDEIRSAIAIAERMITFDCYYYEGYGTLIALHMRSGQKDKAHQLMEKLRELPDVPHATIASAERNLNA